MIQIAADGKKSYENKEVKESDNAPIREAELRSKKAFRTVRCHDVSRLDGNHDVGSSAPAQLMINRPKSAVGKAR